MNCVMCIEIDQKKKKHPCHDRKHKNLVSITKKKTLKIQRIGLNKVENHENETCNEHLSEKRKNKRRMFGYNFHVHWKPNYYPLNGFLRWRFYSGGGGGLRKSHRDGEERVWERYVLWGIGSCLWGQRVPDETRVWPKTEQDRNDAVSQVSYCCPCCVERNKSFSFGLTYMNMTQG